MNKEKIASIKALLLDVDGVLTDGRVYYDHAGNTLRAFNLKDGVGIRLFQERIGPVAICTGKESPAVATRARELGIKHVIQGSEDKPADVERWLNEQELTFPHLAAIGDDLPDLALLELAGYPMAPADALLEIRQVCSYVTEAPGGHGAVREALEHVLRNRDLWPEVIERYRQTTAEARRKDREATEATESVSEPE